MTQKIKNKALGWTVLITSTIIALVYLTILLRDVDFFLNKKEAVAIVVSQREANDGSGFVFQIHYPDQYKQTEVNGGLLVKYSELDDSQKRKYSSIDLLYTKWFNQIYMKGVKMPAITIFIFDFMILFFMWLGIKAGKKMITVPSTGEN